MHRRSFSHLYVHLVWATWDRLPVLDARMRNAVYACIQGECQELRTEVLAIGGIEDHVHLLVRIPTTVAVASLAKQVKGTSSHLVNHQAAPGVGLKWQGGYGAFSISRSHLARVTTYVLEQPQRHAARNLSPDLEIIDELIDT